MWFIYSHLATRSEGVSWLKFWANINRLLTVTRAAASSSPTSIPNEIEYPVDIHTRHLLDVFGLPTGYPLEPFEVTKSDFYEPFGTSVCALILCRLTNKSILGDVESLWVNKAFEEVFMPRFFFLFVTFFARLSAQHITPLRLLLLNSQFQANDPSHMCGGFSCLMTTTKFLVHVWRTWWYYNSESCLLWAFGGPRLALCQSFLDSVSCSAEHHHLPRAYNITRNDGKTRTRKVPAEHPIKLADFKLRRRTSL